jgi:antitoxin component of MazEF toxin-antitoxin module
MVVNMVRLQEHKNRWFITIPRDVVVMKKWKKGQDLYVSIDNNNQVVIRQVHDGQR